METTSGLIMVGKTFSVSHNVCCAENIFNFLQLKVLVDFLD